MRNNGDNIISPKKADIKSKALFIALCVAFIASWLQLMQSASFRIDVVHLLKKYCFSIITPKYSNLLQR